MSKEMLLLHSIVDSIGDIEFILHDNDIKITQAIENRIIKPAIRMHLVKIAEHFAKLKDENMFDILSRFDIGDLKGISAVRNYIAHDYDSVDDHIIDDVLRYDLPRIKKRCQEILNQSR